MLRKFRKSLRRFVFGTPKREINPDEIFLDSSNLPAFDVHQFEGRIEQPIKKHVLLILAGGFLLIGLVFTARAAELQLIEGNQHAALSEQNRLRETVIFSGRGVIQDRNGENLVWNEPGEEEFPERRYTKREGFAHVLGYVSYPARDKAGFYYRDDFLGQAGVEKAFDDTLGGTPGRRIVETNALNEVQSESVIDPPEEGKNMTLSLDADLQAKLYEIIKSTAEWVDFQGGAGAVMDIETGELLAATSYPEFDANVLTEGEPESQIQAYIQDAQTPFLNRFSEGLYTPGSVVKPFVALAALEENVITPEKEIQSTGSISVPNPYFPDQESVFNDWKAHGWVDMEEAIAVSSNVYFYEIGGGYKDQPGLGISKINEYMHRFGFGESSGIDFGQEKTGVVPNPAWKERVFDDAWRLGDTYHTAIGQYGFQVTPLQMLRGVAAIANEGMLLTPTIRKRAVSEAEELSIADEHFKVVQRGLRMAVTDGTAAGLNVPYADIAAKTGTAEIGLQKQHVNAWVVGFLPYDDPQYAFVVTMERGPRENVIGGVYVMRQLLDWMRTNRPEYLGLDSGE